MKDKQTILTAALALPDADREAIAEALWASLPDLGEGGVDEALLDELDRRREELARDPSAAIPWSELRKQL